MKLFLFISFLSPKHAWIGVTPDIFSSTSFHPSASLVVTFEKHLCKSFISFLLILTFTPPGFVNNNFCHVLCIALHFGENNEDWHAVDRDESVLHVSEQWLSVLMTDTHCRLVCFIRSDAWKLRSSPASSYDHPSRSDVWTRRVLPWNPTNSLVVCRLFLLVQVCFCSCWGWASTSTVTTSCAIWGNLERRSTGSLTVRQLLVHLSFLELLSLLTSFWNLPFSPRRNVPLCVWSKLLWGDGGVVRLRFSCLVFTLLLLRLLHHLLHRTQSLSSPQVPL